MNFPVTRHSKMTTASSLFLIFFTIQQTTFGPTNAFCGKGAPGFGLHYDVVCHHLLPVHKATINDGNKTLNITAAFSPASSCPYVIDVLKVTAPSGKSGVVGKSVGDRWSVACEFAW
ncbi:hypothetical protein HELRODRAFT_163504 [Helobdella robusta]|uniref:Uncharacterized protein n=1 Tax=Helobdella robusta TaxID=6412 RepID=T1EU51_HELRO|nr:hypothetical protein HELRODRAFT_163504 [Helobdella robusta]ESN96443.1 hypothetical protein HELRODRAFT_163504 [Helobdella robusta]